MSGSLLVDRLRGMLDPLPGAQQNTVGRAAVLLALTDESDPQLWLIRRSYHLMLHAGQMAFPGGKGEAGDFNLLHTALREAQEEVALPPTQVVPCGALSVQRTLTGYNVAPFVGVVPRDFAPIGDPSEVAAVLRLPLADFADDANLFVDRGWRNGNVRQLPRYQMGSFMVWGMTARFIVELVNRFYDAGFDASK